MQVSVCIYRSKGKFHAWPAWQKKATNNCSGKMYLQETTTCPRRVGESDKRYLLLPPLADACMLIVAGIGSYSF